VKPVVRTHTPDTDIVTGIWSSGRTRRSLYGLRNQKIGPEVTKFGTKKIVEQTGGGDYTPMLAEVIRFAKPANSPVDAGTPRRFTGFMEAADRKQTSAAALAVSVAEEVLEDRRLAV